MIGYIVSDECEAQDNVYLHNVKTYEGLTESAFQLDITFWMMYVYGIDELVVFFSATISFITMSKCLADRLATVRCNKEVEIFSWEFAKAFFDTIVVFLLCILGLMFLTISGEGAIPGNFAMVLMVVLGHPCSWFVPMFSMKLFQNMTVYHLSLIVFLTEFGLNYFLNLVKKVLSDGTISNIKIQNVCTYFQTLDSYGYSWNNPSTYNVTRRTDFCNETYSKVVISVAPEHARA